MVAIRRQSIARGGVPSQLDGLVGVLKVLSITNRLVTRFRRNRRDAYSDVYFGSYDSLDIPEKRLKTLLREHYANLQIVSN